MAISNNGKIAIVAVIAVIICLVAAYVVLDDDGEEQTGDVYIVHTNDTHGDYDEGFGFSSVAAIKNDIQDNGDTVFLFDAGDFMQGSDVVMVTNGQSSINIMNAAGYDAVCPGNHEFDYGLDIFMERIGELNCPAVCSNLVWIESQEPLLDEYVVLEKNGYRMGVFGLMSPQAVESIRPDFIAGLTFLDPVETAAKMVDVLKTKDVDCIVAIGHVGADDNGYPTSQEICDKVAGIDVFVDGHCHDTATRHSESANGTLIAATGMEFSSIGVISVSDGPTSAMVSSYSGADKNTKDTIRAEVNKVRTEMDKVIGHTDVELYASDRAGFFREVTMGDIGTDALKAKSGAEIALITGGSIRASVQPGDITAGMICNAFPFVNFGLMKEITGETLLDMLEWGFRLAPEENGGFLQMSGMTVVWDPSAEPMKRVVSVDVNGEPLQKDRVYSVIGNDYMMLGGNGYDKLTSIPVKENYGLVYEIVIDYIEDLGNVTSVDSDRITTV